jgi:sodium/potassium/calcium exchanger 6
VVVLLSLPATVARDLTIPTLDDQNWSKVYAVCHPFTVPLFVQFILGGSRETVGGVIPVPVLCLIIGILPACAIYVMTHQNKAPRGKLFSIIWSLIAFGMCICWIYMLAGELVSCLSVLGVILNLPPAFLGLTVLAWGNSVGDLFTNTAVARQVR